MRPLTGSRYFLGGPGRRSKCRRFVRFIFVASLVVPLGPVLGDPVRIDPESVQAILEASGVNEQAESTVAAIKSDLQSYFATDPTLSSQEKQAELNTLLNSVFDAERVRNAVASGLERRLLQSDADALLDWLRSPLGLRFTIAEEEASKPGEMERALAESERLMSDNERVELARLIDDLVGATDSSVNAAKLSAEARFLAVTGTEPSEAEYEQFRNELVWIESEYRAEAQYFSALYFLYAYQHLDTEEVSYYAAFLASPPGQRYTSTVGDAFDESLSANVDELARGLAAIRQMPAE